MSFLRTFLGLMADVGLGNPLSRAVSFGCIGFALQYFMKPSISYANVSDGKSIPKQFTLTAKNVNPSMTTIFPWYMWPVSLAILGGLFI